MIATHEKGISELQKELMLCAQSVCQWCHVNNYMNIVKKRIKKIFAIIQHGIDLFDGMYSKY